MKKIVLIFLFVALSIVNLDAQTNSCNMTEKNDTTNTEYRYTYNGQCIATEEKITYNDYGVKQSFKSTFDSSGTLSKTEEKLYFNGDGVHEYTTVYYNSSGARTSTEFIEYFSNGYRERMTTWNYDSNNLVDDKIVVNYKNGKKSTGTKNVYNDNGQKTIISNYTYHTNNNVKTKETTYYNSSGKRTQYSDASYASDGDLTEMSEYFYYSAGGPVEYKEITNYSNGERFKYDKIVYNNTGLRKNEYVYTYYSNGKVKTKDTTTYNSDGYKHSASCVDYDSIYGEKVLVEEFYYYSNGKVKSKEVSKYSNQELYSFMSNDYDRDGVITSSYYSDDTSYSNSYYTHGDLYFKTVTNKSSYNRYEYTYDEHTNELVNVVKYDKNGDIFDVDAYDQNGNSITNVYDSCMSYPSDDIFNELSLYTFSNPKMNNMCKEMYNAGIVIDVSIKNLDNAGGLATPVLTKPYNEPWELTSCSIYIDPEYLYKDYGLSVLAHEFGHCYEALKNPSIYSPDLDYTNESITSEMCSNFGMGIGEYALSHTCSILSNGKYGQGHDGSQMDDDQKYDELYTEFFTIKAFGTDEQNQILKDLLPPETYNYLSNQYKNG